MATILCSILVILSYAVIVSYCEKRTEPESLQGSSDESMRQLMVNLFNIANEYSSTMWALEDLHSVIHQIRNRQKPVEWATRKGTKREDTIPKFTEWANDFVKLDGVELTFIPGKGLGLIATKDLEKNHKVFQAPINHTMSRDNTLPMLNDCLGGPIVYDNVMDEGNWEDELPVALRLVSEAWNPKTIFSTFIDSVPTINEQSHAFLFSPHEIRYLRGSEAFGSAVLYQMEAAAMYAVVYSQMLKHPEECAKMFLTPETFTYDIYTWALALAHTHTVTDPDDNMVFVPYFDMINHNFEPPFLDFDTIMKGDSGTFIAHTMHPVKKGQEVYLNYQNRAHPLHDYFIRWNIIAENVLVELPVQAYPFDNHYEEVKEEVTDDGNKRVILLKSPGYKMPVSNKGFQILSLAASGRTSNVTDQELWHDAWQFLAREIHFRINKYGQTLAEQEEILKMIGSLPDNERSHRAEDCLRLITEEQRIYAGLYEIAKRLAEEDASEYKEIQIRKEGVGPCSDDSEKEDEDKDGDDDDGDNVTKVQEVKVVPDGSTVTPIEQDASRFGPNDEL